jgi:hypothetical protein
MAKLLSGSALRRGGSGEFIDLAGAQPQLPPSETTETGFTVVTDSLLRTSYRSSLGFIEFNTASMYSALPEGTVRILATGSTFLSTSTMSGTLVVEGGIGVGGNMHIGEDIVVNGITVGKGWEGVNNIVLRGSVEETPTEFNEGYNSVAIGYNTLLGLDTSYKDIAIGRYALSAGTNLRDNIAIGDSALKNIGTVDFVIVLNIEDILLTSPVQIVSTNHGLSTGTEIRIFDVLGTDELNENQYWVDVVDESTISLYSDIWINTPVDGAGFTAYISGGSAGVPILRNGNVSIGNSAGELLINGEDNLFIGNNAGKQLSTGSLNIFIGVDVGDEFQGGNGNISIGGDNLVNGLDNQVNIGSVIYYNGSGDLNLNANTEFGLGTRALSTELVGTMTTLTTTNPVVIELPDHNLFTGDRVTINDVVGTAELNGNRYWIKRLSSSTFELYNDSALTSTVDGTAYGIFIAPGTVEKYKIYGALTVRGGAGVERNLIVGETLHAGVAGAESFFYGDVLPVGTVNLGSSSSKFNSLYLEGSTIYLSTVTLKSPDSLSFDIESSEGFVRQTVGDITLTSGLDSTNTSSGSVIVEGGVGIGKHLYVGQELYADSPTNSTGTSSGAVVVAGGAGIAKDVWIGGNLYVEGLLNATIEGSSSSTFDIVGGEEGSIVYQEAQDSTAFLPIGTEGQVLVSNGTTPYWGVASASSANTATNADNIFVNTVTNDTLYYIGLTEQIGNYSPVDSDTLLTYDTTDGKLTTTNLNVISTDSSTTSAVGQSVTVAGGIGVEKDSYFAGGIYGRDGSPDENYLIYAPRVTISNQPPAFPRIGDYWIYPEIAGQLQYITEEGNSYWIQIATV